jgi:uncharacterized protein (DUF779 family)
MKRIDATEALELIAILKEKHGELMFYQAGGLLRGCVLKRRILPTYGRCVGEKSKM